MLAIDPSSPFSGGAILGDRVRMRDHTADAGVFIRSMATRGHLGGLSLATPEAVRVLDAAGWPWIVDRDRRRRPGRGRGGRGGRHHVVVVNPGWGDAVQANKAGLMEIADVFVINKADRPGVEDTRRDLERMLDLTDRSRLATAGRGHHRHRPATASTSCGRRSAGTGRTSSTAASWSAAAGGAVSATSSPASSPPCSTSGRCAAAGTARLDGLAARWPAASSTRGRRPTSCSP